MSVPNVPVIQHTIIKIIEKEIRNLNVCSKLLEYSTYMELNIPLMITSG